MLPDESAFLWVWTGAVEGHLNGAIDDRLQVFGQGHLEDVILKRLNESS